MSGGDSPSLRSRAWPVGRRRAAEARGGGVRGRPGPRRVAAARARSPARRENDKGSLPMGRKSLAVLLWALAVCGAVGGPERPGAATLFEAAGAGDLAGVQRHLQQGADVNARDDKLWTPLMFAAAGSHLDVVRHLVDKGADVNAKGKWGYTPLMWAALNGHLDVAACLLEHGADATVRDDRGATARMFATAGGHTNVVELLRRHGVAE